ncbi:MAG: 3-hydroxyisobutyrate dehydrogenase [Anaerocolumna sp.]|nr:3-hydroxyisobutyrate dehydrogenase [Anaerocolumna sp.]
MRIGFIGYGEAAFEMSKGLKNEGLKEILAFDVMHDHEMFGELLKKRTQEAGVELVYSAKEVIDNSQIVIVAVPGSKALATSKQLYEYLNDDIIYVDVSASTVKVKQDIWDLIKSKTKRFVDAAMLGPLPMHQHKVPIAASGTGTDEFIQIMSPYGMKIEKVSETAGDATAIKLIRSMFTKGLSSLLLEIIEISTKTGVTDTVIKSISGSIDEVSFEYTINRLLTSGAIHAERRAHELIGSIEMMNEYNVEPTMSKAAKAKLEWLAEKNLNEVFKGKTPNSFKEFIQYL